MIIRLASLHLEFSPRPHSGQVLEIGGTWCVSPRRRCSFSALLALGILVGSGPRPWEPRPPPSVQLRLARGLLVSFPLVEDIESVPVT